MAGAEGDQQWTAAGGTQEVAAPPDVSTSLL